MLISRLLGFLISKAFKGRFGLLLHRLLLFFIFAFFTVAVLCGSLYLISNHALNQVTSDQVNVIKQHPEKTFEILSTVQSVKEYIRIAPTIALASLLIPFIASIKAKKYYNTKRRSHSQVKKYDVETEVVEEI